ncbi:WGR domain-containing protein [Epibacterium sp. SM1969]|uniref:WGR domain-containing protein n=1 Tax=Tritonibacter aquimaris TaxID=2663379 RepID=A0A844AUC0_9RHOB|nr:WGR domain-containing protein [Tritonibacter aquimaris]MQY43427.1 WGR domain-containing protein [Tritonibacter aquimaris]
MFVRLEKFDHVEGQHRYCVLSLSQTLLGEWCVELASGPLGDAGGTIRRSYFSDYNEALALAEENRARQIKRGFVPIPVQLGLF